MRLFAAGGFFSNPKARRHAIFLALILAACLAFFTAVGAGLLPGARQVYKRQPVIRSPQTLALPLRAEDRLLQHIIAVGPLHGVSLHVGNGGRALQGELQIDLLHYDTRELLLSSKTPLSALPENGFVDFLFNGQVDGGVGTWYFLQITAHPAGPEDVPYLYRSAEVPDYYYDENMKTAQYTNLSIFVLEHNGREGPEPLELTYLTGVTGGFMREPYVFFAAVLTLVLLAAYVMLFILRQPLHRVFVLCALGLGLVFMFLIPPRAAPDEYAHISTAYHYSNSILGAGEGDDFAKQMLWMREGDATKLWNYDTTSVGLFAYKDMAENLFTKVPEGPGAPVLVRGYQVMPLQLAAPTLGVVLARLLGLGRTGLFMLGRLCNLLFYTVMVSRAIRRMPLAKPLLFSVALLPMALQLAASFSYDTYVFALSVYLLACCLDWRVNKKPVGARQIVLLAVLCLLLAPAKSAYVPLVGLLFLVKPGQFATKRVCHAARAGIVAASVGLWLWYTAGSLLLVAGTTAAAQPVAAVATAPLAGAAPLQPAPAQTQKAPLPGAVGAAQSTQARPFASAVPSGGGQQGVHLEDYKGEVKADGNAVQLYNAGYILRHIPATVKILLRTVWEQSPLWLQGLVGGRLGESIAVDIQVSWVLVGGLLLVLVLCCLPSGEDRRLLPAKHRVGFLGMVLLCAGAVVLASLTWTPANYRTLFGVQGRYLLPVLPLLLLAGRGGSLRFARPRRQVLAFAQVVLVVLCQASAFAAIVRLGW